MDLPKCRIGDQVVFSPKDQSLSYMLGVVNHAQINGNGWEYKIKSNKDEFKVMEGDIKGMLFSANEKLTKAQKKQAEAQIQL